MPPDRRRTLPREKIDVNEKTGQDSGDPKAEREAGRYEHPVPSREAVLDCLEAGRQPLNFKQLCAALEVEGERDTDAFGRRTRAMERDGQVLRNRSGHYGLIDKMDMVTGEIIGHPDGFGFLQPEAGGEDLFLSPKQMRKVMHGDRVVGRVMGVDRRGRSEGAIIEVLERAHQTVVGRYVNENQHWLRDP